MYHRDSVMRSTLSRALFRSHRMCSASHVWKEYSIPSLNCLEGRRTPGMDAFGGSSGSGVSLIQPMKFGSSIQQTEVEV